MAKPMCQSCGMPLKDSNKGTEADGNLSQDFCNLCYQNGAYLQPDMTMEEMQQISVQAMRKMHFPGFMARMIAKSQIPKLKRWQV